MNQAAPTMPHSAITSSTTGIREGVRTSATATSQVSVTLGVGLAPYQKTLPESLMRAGMLSKVFRFGVNLDVLQPNGNESLKLIRRFKSYRNVNRLLWGVWTRLPGTRRQRTPIVASCWLADWLTARQIKQSRIFHSWTGVSLAGLRVAKSRNMITLVENPMLHPRDWQREVLAECKRFGVSPADCDAVLPDALMERREREFDLCDWIVVPSDAARQSLQANGWGNKAVVVRPGVDHDAFRPSDAKRNSAIFRVCYVGRIELAKGTFYLIEAWKRLRLRDAELVLVGEIRPEVQPIVAGYENYNVRLAGRVAPERVIAYYGDSDVFAFPSVQEGLALVLLEAMACGVPVIATESSGAHDCVTHGTEGWIVPTRNVDALAEQMLWCYEHRAELAEMGKLARMKIENHFTLQHYVDRQIALYRSLAAGS